MLALDRACSRSLRKGGARWSLCRIWHVLSSRIEKSRPADRRTAPARSAHAHYSTCLDASSSAAQYQSTKGTFKGRPYTCISYCNRVGHTNGPIRFRQQLSVSTSGCTLTLERQGSFLRARHFPLVTRRPGSQRRVDGSIVVNNSLCSSLIFSLVRMAFCNRVEYKQPGRPQGRPNSRDRIATGSDTLRDRSVSINNSCPLPLATL